MPPRYNRPARVQVDASQMKKTINEVTGNYNIWYNRYTGGDNYKYKPLTRAEYRCDIERDSGLTKADNNPNASYFCIHFAHGCCSKGKDCTFLHRVPDEYDKEETTKDCFGREKFFEERQDMGGVGTFSRINKTLYVGHISTSPDREEIVKKHFGAFGDIEYIKVLKDKAVAFVQYKLRSVAEFVKEAMYGQSLDDDEVLNVRWATEDPNPKVKQELQRKAEEQVYAAVNSNLPVIGEYGTILDYEYGYQNMPDMYGYDQNQYSQAQAQTQITQDLSQYDKYYESYYSSEYGTNPELFQNNSQYYQYQGYETQTTYSQPVITETVNNTASVTEEEEKEIEKKEKVKETKGILSSNSLKTISNLLRKTNKKRPPPPPPPKEQSSSTTNIEIKKKRPPPPPPTSSLSPSNSTKSTTSSNIKVVKKRPPPPPPPSSTSEKLEKEEQIKNNKRKKENEKEVEEEDNNNKIRTENKNKNKSKIIKEKKKMRKKWKRKIIIIK
jgi:hypothetical protein